VDVLIVEDNLTVARLLAEAISEVGYEARLVGDGLEAVEMAQRHSFGLILLDVMLPGLDGFQVCRQLREQGVTSAILMITARDAVEDKIAGLDAGADDYIVKPFVVAELLARMRALGRRGPSTSPSLRVADLTLDPSTRRATRGGKSVSLSATEYVLLEFLMRHTGRVLSRAEILDHVWQYDFAGTDNVLDVYIGYLRQKLDRGHAQRLIHTVRGVGFSLKTEQAAPST